MIVLRVKKMFLIFEQKTAADDTGGHSFGSFCTFLETVTISKTPPNWILHMCICNCS